MEIKLKSLVSTNEKDILRIPREWHLPVALSI